MQLFYLTAFVMFFRFCVNESKIPSIFKQASITPAYKKSYRGYKRSFRPLSTPPVFERITGS